MEILVLLFVVAAIVFYLIADPIDHLAESQDSHDPRFRAVKIKPCEQACQAALQCSSIIFLSGQAPKLPLNACDRMTACDCQFRHYADRRQQDDRRSNGYVMRDMYYQGERRSAKRVGRRASDPYSDMVSA